MSAAPLLCLELCWNTCAVHMDGSHLFCVGIVLQDYLSQPSVSMNDKSCRKFQKELLLAHCNLLRRTLSEKGVAQCVDVLQKYVNAILLCQYFILEKSEKESP